MAALKTFPYLVESDEDCSTYDVCLIDEKDERGALRWLPEETFKRFFSSERIECVFPVSCSDDVKNVKIEEEEEAAHGGCALRLVPVCLITNIAVIESGSAK